MIFSFSPANSRISRPNCLISNSREDLYGRYSPFKRQRDMRTAVLNDTLEEAFRHCYPGFRLTNDDEAVVVVA
jgi:hypothetical protein